MNRVNINRKQALFRSSLLSLLFIVLLSGVASAQEEKPTPSDDDVNAIASQMYCPVCEIIPLDVCETKACEQWRELIREKLAAGWSEKQIKDYFVLQYGDRVLAEPPARGFNWLVYLLPPLVFVAGSYFLYRILSGMRKPAVPLDSQSDETAALPDDSYLARMEEALRERKKRNG